MSRKTLIQNRRDTAANWTSVNPTLAAGEIGYETDTGKFKMGNGATAWSSLTYFIAGAGGGISSLNGLSGSSQTFATGTSGTDFGISSVGTVHTFNIPDASATARGLITTGAQTIAGVKTFSSVISGSISGNAATVTTNANLTGPVTSVGNATTIAANAVADSQIASHTSTKISITAKGQLNASIAYTDQANTFGAFDQTFKAGNLKVVDATVATKVMTFNLAGQTADTTLTLSSLLTTSQTLQIPNISSTDTFQVLGLAQTVTGVHTYSSSSLAMNNPANTFAYTIEASAITAARTLTLPLITQAETLAVQPQILDFNPAKPTGTTSTAGVMMGLAASFTPRVTGRVLIIVSGQCFNSTNHRSCVMTVRTGTGTAPTNGAALTGTAQSPAVTSLGASTTNTFPFCIPTIVTGLTVGTAIWIDMSLANVTSGTASMSNITINAIEI